MSHSNPTPQVHSAHSVLHLTPSPSLPGRGPGFPTFHPLPVLSCSDLTSHLQHLPPLHTLALPRHMASLPAHTWPSSRHRMAVGGEVP